ncbi:MAG: hypothetical protein JSV43_04200 [Methanobacteriota archaeon]|nr:MAG: hypothetical protein JSV43_04200 [Euryarchaeota archaeon]
MVEIDVLPRIPVIDGEIVEQEGDEYLSMDVDAVQLINRMIEEHGKALLVDLDGVFNNRPGLGFIKEFETKPVWVDSGVRSAENVIDVFVAGAEKVVMNTKTLVGFGEVRKANELSDQLVFQVDAIDGRTVAYADVLKQATPRNLLEEVARIGLDVGIYMEEGGGDPYPSMLHGITDELGLYLGGLAHSDQAWYEETGIRGIVIDVKELI